MEQLRQVFAELHAVTIRETVSFHMAHTCFDEHGDPRDPEGVNSAAETLLDCAAGKLRIPVIRLPMSQAAYAHQQLEAAHIPGKIALTP